jgi:hypothetical protein
MQSLVYQTEATVLFASVYFASAVNKSVQTNIPKSTESVISSARNQHSSQTAYWKANPRKYGETFFVVQECIGSISASDIRKWISNPVHSWRDAYMPEILEKMHDMDATPQFLMQNEDADTEHSSGLKSSEQRERGRGRGRMEIWLFIFWLI